MRWKQLLRKFNLLDLFKDIFYRLDWRKPNYSSVKEFLEENLSIAFSPEAQPLLPSFKSKNQDALVREILIWVHKNIRYVSDKRVWHTPEKWQNIQETLELRTGDCEDGAILIYVLAVINGVNPIQIFLCAGDVQDPFNQNKTTGHAYIKYASDKDYDYKEDKLNFKIYDWTYYYKPYGKLSEKYKKDWFCVNHLKI